MSGAPLPLLGSDQPWASGPVTAWARCVLAPNPSPLTLDGTNTWVLGEPGSARVVVDPGPADPGHAAAIEEACGGAPALILLTHGHPDHAESARALGERWGVDVRALDPQHRLGDEGLTGGEVVDLGDWAVDVVATPGHTADSVCLVIRQEGSVLTGDTVLGRGTTVVAWPDGQLGEYLDSLRRLRDLAGTGVITRILPGHGPVLERPLELIDAYLDHRAARLAQVEEVMADGVTDPAAIVAVVYADVPRAVWPAAELSVRAQVDYLARRPRRSTSTMST